MKFFVSFFIVFTIALCPVLPLVNYAVNYDYIVRNLCKNNKEFQSTCKGKCYIKKELSKTEKQTPSQNIRIFSIDVFISNEILTYFNTFKDDFFLKTFSYNPSFFYSSEFFGGYSIRHLFNFLLTLISFGDGQNFSTVINLNQSL